MQRRHRLRPRSLVVETKADSHTLSHGGDPISAVACPCALWAWFSRIRFRLLNYCTKSVKKWEAVGEE